MPSDRSAEALGHIRENIVLAQEFAADLTPEALLRDVRTRYAIVRCLEIISEASRRLDPPVKARHPEIDWPAIAAAGNVYRHQYEGLRLDVLWRTVHEALPPLLAAVEAEGLPRR